MREHRTLAWSDDHRCNSKLGKDRVTVFVDLKNVDSIRWMSENFTSHRIAEVIADVIPTDLHPQLASLVLVHRDLDRTHDMVLDRKAITLPNHKSVV